MSTLNDALEASAQRLMRRVAEQMEKVYSGELLLHIAAAQIGLMPFELEDLYNNKSLQGSQYLTKEQGRAHLTMDILREDDYGHD